MNPIPAKLATSLVALSRSLFNSFSHFSSFDRVSSLVTVFELSLAPASMVWNDMTMIPTKIPPEIDISMVVIPFCFLFLD